MFKVNNKDTRATSLSYRLTLSQRSITLRNTYNNKKLIVSVIYRSPSQNNSEFDLFLSNFLKLLTDINKRKPFLFVITSDFNSSWWPKDINTTEGPTHIQASSFSCIDLIFTNQPKVSVNSEIILNIFRNYVPNKYITIDDKDPVWMNETIKSEIKSKNAFYKKYFRKVD